MASAERAHSAVCDRWQGRKRADNLVRRQIAIRRVTRVGMTASVVRRLFMAEYSSSTVLCARPSRSPRRAAPASAMDYPSFESVVETLRAADISTSASAMAASTDLLGDKKRIRKTFVRHVVGRVERDFPGRPFSELAILELGAGAGFFALSYAERKWSALVHIAHPVFRRVAARSAAFIT